MFVSAFVCFLFSRNRTRNLSSFANLIITQRNIILHNIFHKLPDCEQPFLSASANAQSPNKHGNKQNHELNLHSRWYDSEDISMWTFRFYFLRLSYFQFEPAQLNIKVFYLAHKCLHKNYAFSSVLVRDDEMKINECVRTVKSHAVLKTS